jgi:hypothetical protein
MRFTWLMPEWGVLIETAGFLTIEEANDPAWLLHRFGPKLEDFPRWGVNFSGSSWSARLRVETQSPHEAVAVGESIVARYIEDPGLPNWPVVRIQATLTDHLEDEAAFETFVADNPDEVVWDSEWVEVITAPDLIGTQEVREMLGLSRQRLHELKSGGRFPEPLVELASGPVWLRPAVERFIESWDRRPGRPRRLPTDF